MTSEILTIDFNISSSAQLFNLSYMGFRIRNKTECAGKSRKQFQVKKNGEKREIEM